VDDRLERMWLEVVQLASTISFSEDEDNMIWQFTSNGIYSSQFLCKIINFRGILPVFVPAVWNLNIPPRVQFILWLLCKNIVLTRDNLGKSNKLEVGTCLFCEEKESCQHMFFDYVVAVRMWKEISNVIGREVGGGFESIGVCWHGNKKFTISNMLIAAALWGLWKLWNGCCFRNIS
jgi:hypothetical protein